MHRGTVTEEPPTEPYTLVTAPERTDAPVREPVDLSTMVEPEQPAHEPLTETEADLRAAIARTVQTVIQPTLPIRAILTELRVLVARLEDWLPPLTKH